MALWHRRAFDSSFVAVCVIVVSTCLASCGPSDDLYGAIKRGNVRSVRRISANTQLLSQLQPVTVGPLNISYKMTPLQAAAFWGREEAVTVLLQAGAPVNAVDDLGMTALHRACGDQLDPAPGSSQADLGRPPSPSLVRILLDAGADVNFRGHRQITPLHCAARVAGLDVVRALIDAGADVDAVVEVGNTVLTEAISNPDPRIVELLVKRGASPDAGNGIGATPLMLAAYIGREDVVAILLSVGANPAATDPQGYSAIDYANGRPWPLKVGTVQSRQGIINRLQTAQR